LFTRTAFIHHIANGGGLLTEILDCGSTLPGHVGSTDEKDTPYVALPLHLDGRLWTDDEQLKAALRAKGFDRFFEAWLGPERRLDQG